TSQSTVQTTSIASTPHRRAQKIATPSLSDKPAPLTVSTEPKSNSALTLELSAQPLPVKPVVEQPQAITTAPAESVSDFPNPFTEGSESEADVKIRPGQTSGPASLPKTHVVIAPKIETPAAKPIEPEKLATAETEQPKTVQIAPPTA